MQKCLFHKIHPLDINLIHLFHKSQLIQSTKKIFKVKGANISMSYILLDSNKVTKQQQPVTCF